MKKALPFIALLIVSAGVYSQTSANDYYQYGNVEFALEDYHAAITNYTKVIQLNPTDSSYIKRGLAEIRLNDNKNAMDDFTGAIELNPKNALAFYNRGNAKRRLKDTAGACLDWQKALNLGHKAAAEMIKQYCK